MKRSVKTIYRFDDNDALCHGRDVEEAFNRMMNFAPELYEPEKPKEKRHPARRAFNIITSSSGAEFERMDVEVLRDYAVAVVKRAKDRIAGGKVMLEMIESVRQAADHLTVVLGNVAMAIDAADEAATKPPHVSFDLHGYPQSPPVSVPRTCGSCAHMRLRDSKDIKVESGHDQDTQWCAVNAMPTMPHLLRCGGDDYQ